MEYKCICKCMNNNKNMFLNTIENKIFIIKKYYFVNENNNNNK